jgi:FSR family fosmidomycin resistance protein-like MFS transporter
MGALSQPLFGMIADRVGTGWVAGGGLLWMCVFFSLALFQPGYGALALLVLASLGSGAFHPAATAEATGRARARFASAETTATSFFFFTGTAGYSLSPIVGGLMLDRWGIAGLLTLPVIVAPLSLVAARHLGSKTGDSVTLVPNHNPANFAAGRQLIFPLIIMTALRSWAQSNMTAFIPKFHSDLGASASTYGLIAGLSMAGSAVGEVAGGWLADHLGKRKVTFWTLLLSALPLALYPLFGRNGMAYLLAPLAGALTAASHSISVVLAQQVIPGRAGMASGLVLGFIFTSGALGTWLSGLQADLSGFPAMFWTSAGLCVAGALVSLLMKSD